MFLLGEQKIYVFFFYLNLFKEKKIQRLNWTSHLTCFKNVYFDWRFFRYNYKADSFTTFWLAHPLQHPRRPLNTSNLSQQCKQTIRQHWPREHMKASVGQGSCSQGHWVSEVISILCDPQTKQISLVSCQINSKTRRKNFRSLLIHYCCRARRIMKTITSDQAISTH